MRYHLSILAEVNRSGGLLDQSARDVDEALALAEQQDEQFWSVELYKFQNR